VPFRRAEERIRVAQGLRKLIPETRLG
jgi:hypothetical protein